MEKEEVKKIFLDIAVAAISCDGHVDDREIEKLEEIEKKSPYFSELDLSQSLQEALEGCMENLDLFQNNLFKRILDADLNIVQQLSAIDVSFEIILADQKIEPTEIEFVKKLRSKLNVTDDILFERFGHIEFLFNADESEFKSSGIKEDELQSGISKKKK